jgi:hypothetical protein
MDFPIRILGINKSCNINLLKLSREDNYKLLKDNACEYTRHQGEGFEIHFHWPGNLLSSGDICHGG